MTILLLAGLLQAGPPAPPPVVTPLVLSRNIEEGPAFMIDCRNTTGAPVSSGSRLDDSAPTRGALVVPLTAGRHTIAVRCGDTWSRDLAFYWER